MLETISYEERGGVATITLGRPKSRAAINSLMRTEIVSAIKKASRGGPDAPRTLVVRGQGAVFSKGHDFEEEPIDAPDEVERVLATEYAPMIEAFDNCPIPTIAAVNGPAIGVGAAVALACDLIIMQDRAFFSMPFLELGLIPDAGCLHFLQRRVGTQRALGAILFGERITAAQATEWGLAWETASRHEFNDRIEVRAHQVSKVKPSVLGSLKTWLKGSTDRTVSESLALEARLQAACVAKQAEDRTELALSA